VPQDELQALRIAVYGNDSAGLVRMLNGEVRPDVLQMVGDALVAATRDGVPGADELARASGDALRERAWPGDDELRAELDAALGRGPTPPGTPLPVDLEELSDLLEASGGSDGGCIDLETGDVWAASTIEFFSEKPEEDTPDFEDPDRWLYVGPEGSGEGYRDMEDFIDTVSNAGRADRLGIAIDGRGAFRRFKDTVSRWPEEEERWYRFSDERQRGRAREWLSAAGYRVANRTVGR
jgi:hypothetical protein